MRRAAIIAVLLAATFGGACSDENDLTYFDASLSPQNEVPARASNAVKAPDPQPRSATRAPGSSPVSRTNASTMRALACGANTS